MSRRVIFGLLSAACAVALALLPVGSALAGNPNAGDVWVDNVGQPAGPGHEMDPHLACQNIDLWGAGLADSSGSYTIDGWPPSGSQEQDYAGSWSYDQAAGGTQVLDVISVQTLIANAIANGDAPQNGQGFHFKLEFSQDPQKHKTFWVDCQLPSIATHAASASAGQPIHDTAILTGGSSPTGTITWNLYASSDTTCATSLHSVSEAVNGDGTYTSPGVSVGPGSYQWVAMYSGDAGNASASTSCNDPQETSVVQTTPAAAIAVVKLERDATSGGSFTHGPLTGGPGDTIDYQMTVLNTGNTPLVISFSDPRCDAGTLSGPTVETGSFDAASGTLSSGGVLQYTCSHVLSATDAPAYTNTASATGQPPTGGPVSASDTVQALVSIAPGLTVVKLQRDGSAGAFTSGMIAARVGDTIEYEIRATNTGNVALTLSLSDPGCDAGTIAGPVATSGTLVGNLLLPGATAQYTCSHLLGAGDAPSFTNVATVTGQPPSGPPLSGTGSVVATVAIPGISVVKLQREGSRGPFTTATIMAEVGTRIEYEIEVTNTGNVPLTLSLSDPLCNPGTITGPTVIRGSLSGATLEPGGEAQYTCSHLLRGDDASPFMNTATVTGQPPVGSPVVGTSSVTARKQAIKAKRILRCGRGKVRKVRRVHGKLVVVCVQKRSVHPIHIHRHPRPPHFTG
jgi:uncharacterized repeat protein (TIGR01451 family)